jgi:hypothetical protein
MERGPDDPAAPRQRGAQRVAFKLPVLGDVGNTLEPAPSGKKAAKPQGGPPAVAPPRSTAPSQPTPTSKRQQGRYCLRSSVRDNGSDDNSDSDISLSLSDDDESSIKGRAAGSGFQRALLAAGVADQPARTNGGCDEPRHTPSPLIWCLPLPAHHAGAVTPRAGVRTMAGVAHMWRRTCFQLEDQQAGLQQQLQEKEARLAAALLRCQELEAGAAGDRAAVAAAGARQAGLQAEARAKEAELAAALNELASDRQELAAARQELVELAAGRQEQQGAESQWAVDRAVLEAKVASLARQLRRLQQCESQWVRDRAALQAVSARLDAKLQGASEGGRAAPGAAADEGSSGSGGGNAQRAGIWCWLWVMILMIGAPLAALPLLLGST